jgi:hypothetical protein
MMRHCTPPGKKIFTQVYINNELPLSGIQVSGILMQLAKMSRKIDHVYKEAPAVTSRAVHQSPAHSCHYSRICACITAYPKYFTNQVAVHFILSFFIVWGSCKIS